MNWTQRILAKENWRSGALGSVIAVVLGLCFAVFPIGETLRLLSYDLPFEIRGATTPPKDVVILYLDEESTSILKQTQGAAWDPLIHTRLVKMLTSTALRPNLIVFDILFSEINDTNAASYGQLAEAMRQHGKVAVAAHYRPRLQEDVIETQSKPELAAASIAQAAASGIVEFPAHGDGAVRSQMFFGKQPNLAWAGADLLGKAPRDDPGRVRWIKYYGPRKTLRSYPYFRVLSNDVPATALAGKTIFVGKESAISTEAPTRAKDELPTPYTRWYGGLTPGVEIQATAFLNLINHDWLDQVNPVLEFLIELLVGVVAGFGFLAIRPWTAAVLSVTTFFALAGIGIFLVFVCHLWFAWMVPAAVQIPAALSWAVLVNTRKVYHEKELLEESVATAKAAAASASAHHDTGSGPLSALSVINEAAVAAKAEAPTVIAAEGATTRLDPRTIGDHELIRPIGKGAYGEVWLGRSLVGIYRAVKVVYRRNFEHPAPFEREFRGLKRFAPVSTSHRGFVQILHVGKNDAEGYFYYVMELGDDENSGSKIDSQNYSARNLAKELHKRGKLSPAECASLGIELAAALHCLHEHELIHRDIKPSNIIFVKGVAKLADIGLVTEIKSTPSEATYVGTPGYIAPEGPGSKAADIFSLGKVLFACAMGNSQPSGLNSELTNVPGSESEALLELRKIVSKARHPDLSLRHASAAELQAELTQFQARFKHVPARGELSVES